MKTILAVILNLAVVAGASAQVRGQTHTLANETSLAYSQNFDYDANDINTRKLSAQVTYTSATVATATFTDGRTSSGTITIVSTTSLHGTRIGINGSYFSFGRIAGTAYANDTIVAVGADVTASAYNLSAAIDAHASVGSVIDSTNTAGVIDLVSEACDGVAYALSSSKPSVVSLGGAAMGLGVAATVNASNDSITIASHGMSTGLKVALTGSNLPSGLSATDYYVYKVDANTIKLSSTAALAIAGTVVDITAVSVDTTANTYTLTPAAITGTPSFKWQASNDGDKWGDLSVSSVTMSAYTLGGAVSIWDLGDYNYRWLRMAVVAPTTGGIYLKATLNKKD